MPDSSADITEIHEPLPEQPHRPPSNPKPGKDEESADAAADVTVAVAVAKEGADSDLESSVPARPQGRPWYRTTAVRYAKNPLGRRVVCIALLFAASELYPFLGTAILRGRAPERPKDVAAACAVGAAIVAAVYLVGAVVGRWAAGSGWVLNQPRLVVLAVEAAVCSGMGCFAPVVGVAVYTAAGGTVGGGSGDIGLRAVVLEMLVVSVIGTFVVVLSPVVLLAMVATGAALRTLKASATAGR